MLPASPPSKKHKDLGIQTGLCLCVDLNRGIQVLGVGSYIFKILLEVDGRTWNFELDLCPDRKNERSNSGRPTFHISYLELLVSSLTSSSWS